MADPAASSSWSASPHTNPLLQSPNAIPPRKSSAGHASPPSRTANILRPVPEADWISQSTHARTTPPAISARRSSQNNPTTPSYPQTNILLNMASSSSQPPSSSSSSSSPPPAPDPSRFATDDFHFIGGTNKTWAHKQDRVVAGPFEYLNGQPGKDFRSLLIGAFHTWLDVRPAALDVITKVVGMLHTASLLIDDVEDGSLLRRGLPVAHSLFGVPQTINSANYVYFLALAELQTLRNPAVVTVYAEELVNLHRGQGMDLFWRDTLTCPTEDEYLEMVGNKTGGLFRLGIKLMQAESRADKVVDCVPLVNLIGLVFQIRDDYQNLHSTEYSENKGLAEDLTEGKFSFPIIHSIRSDPGNLQLINILKQRTSDEEVKRYAVKYMHGTGSFDYTLKVLDVLIERARKVAKEIDDGRGEGRNKGIERILDAMVIGGKGEIRAPPKA